MNTRCVVACLLGVAVMTGPTWAYEKWVPKQKVDWQKRHEDFYQALKAIYDKAVADEAASPDFLADLEKLLKQHQPEAKGDLFDVEASDLPEFYHEAIKWGIENARKGRMDLIRIVGGTLNDRQIATSMPAVRVAPKARVTGTIKIVARNSHDGNAVFPVGWTTSWGDHEKSARTISRWVRPGDTEHEVEIDLEAPEKTGHYFIAFSCAGQMTVANIMSVTAWPRKRDKWNDGNDIADLSREQVIWGIKHGWFPLKELDPNDKYVPGYYGGSAVLVEVERASPEDE